MEQGRLAEAAQLVDEVSGDSGVPARDHFVDMMVCQAVAKILDQRGDTGAAFHNADTAVRLARRGGGLLELANAFGELTDPAIQRARFAADRAKKRALYGYDYPQDEDFLAALEHGMPESAGIALGVDRLVMLATGAEDIAEVLWAPVA